MSHGEAKALYGCLVFTNINNHQRMGFVSPCAHAVYIVGKWRRKYLDALALQEAKETGDRTIAAMPTLT